VLKISTGKYNVWKDGQKVYSGLGEQEVINYFNEITAKKEEKTILNVEKSLSKEGKVSRSKKALYYIILILSAGLLAATYVFGIKLDAIVFKRENQEIYDTIRKIGNEKRPEMKVNSFDEIYYTLNYYAHQNEYFTNPENEFYVNSYLATYYQENNLPTSALNDRSYSGLEFNQYFQYPTGEYVVQEEVYRRIGLIMGENNISILENLIYKYLEWDLEDVKSNIAYHYEIIEDSTFDRNVDYYEKYLVRNIFIKLFLNDSSKFINEYNMFEMIGWLNWVSMSILLLYIVLAFCIWLFSRKSIKISKFLIILISVSIIIILVPLILQFFFEGLIGDPRDLLNLIENTQFTTATTIMNLMFDYVLKFVNLGVTGIITIALPLKVIRHFVNNAIEKLNKNVKIIKQLDKKTSLETNIDVLSYRL